MDVAGDELPVCHPNYMTAACSVTLRSCYRSVSTSNNLYYDGTYHAVSDATHCQPSACVIRLDIGREVTARGWTAPTGLRGDRPGHPISLHNCYPHTFS